MNYNFTDRVRKVLAMAREEAIRLQHDYVGTEHILLGLIREGEGVAAAVLNNLAVDLEQVQEKVDLLMSSLLEAIILVVLTALAGASVTVGGVMVIAGTIGLERVTVESVRSRRSSGRASRVSTVPHPAAWTTEAALSSPIRRISLRQHGQWRSVRSSTCSIRSRCAGKWPRLRRRSERGL